MVLHIYHLEENWMMIRMVNPGNTILIFIYAIIVHSLHHENPNALEFGTLFIQKDNLFRVSIDVRIFLRCIIFCMFVHPTHNVEPIPSTIICAVQSKQVWVIGIHIQFVAQRSHKSSLFGSHIARFFQAHFVNLMNASILHTRKHQYKSV